MKAYHTVVAALLMAVAACSDSVSPSATQTAADLSPDLELELPNLRPLALAPEDSSARLVANAQSTVHPMSGLYADDDFGNDTGYDSEIPLEYRLAAARSVITRLEIDVGFIPGERVAFGQLIGESMGSYYKNHVLLKVRYGNSQIGQNEATESESCLCAHLFTPWGRTVDTTVPITGNCGHIATATGTLDAQLRFLTAALKLFNLRDDVGTTTDSSFQPDCEPTNSGTGGGGGGVEGDDVWYLCYWEDYYYAGEFVRRQELGCIPLGAE